MFDKSSRGRPPRGDRERSRSRSPVSGRGRGFGHSRGAHGGSSSGGGGGRYSSPGPMFEGNPHIPPFANGPHHQMPFPGGPPMPSMGNSARPSPAENRPGNELEIIVINRDQW